MKASPRAAGKLSISRRSQRASYCLWWVWTKAQTEGASFENDSVDPKTRKTPVSIYCGEVHNSGSKAR
jgi:hypothetical protein